MAVAEFSNAQLHQNGMKASKMQKTGGSASLRPAATAMTSTYVATDYVNVGRFGSGRFTFNWGTLGAATTIEIRADICDGDADPATAANWNTLPQTAAPGSNVVAMEPLTIQLTASEMDTTINQTVRHDEIDRAIRVCTGWIRLRIKETGTTTTYPTCGVEFAGGVN